MTFQDVKVFAGDKFLPAADVAYNNLTWDITATLSEASSTSDGPGGIQSTATLSEASSTSEGRVSDSDGFSKSESQSETHNSSTVTTTLRLVILF